MAAKKCFFLWMSAFATFIINTSVAQSDLWALNNGIATADRTITLPGITSDEIYKGIERWLIGYYKDPDDNVKARVIGEYIRGVGYFADFMTYGSLTSADLQYTYIFSIADAKVTIKITDAVLIHSTQEGYRLDRVEEYFRADHNRRRDPDAVNLAAKLNEFSDSLFRSFEKAVLCTVDK